MGVVIKKVPIRNTTRLLFKGFCVYVASGKQIVINSSMLLRIFGSKMEQVTEGWIKLYHPAFILFTLSRILLRR
jgi:hypothetical protein